jgi:hypothetical protein
MTHYEFAWLEEGLRLKSKLVDLHIKFEVSESLVTTSADSRGHLCSPLQVKVSLMSKEAIQIFPLDYCIKREARAPVGSLLAERWDTYHECLSVLLACPTFRALVLPSLLMLIQFNFLHGVKHLSFGDRLYDLVRFLHF